MTTGGNLLCLAPVTMDRSSLLTEIFTISIFIIIGRSVCGQLCDQSCGPVIQAKNERSEFLACYFNAIERFYSNPVAVNKCRLLQIKKCTTASSALIIH